MLTSITKLKIRNFLIDIRKIFSLALPMAGTQLINVVSGFLCMVMLANLGHQVLAASALIVLTQLAIMVSGTSILFSLSVLIGHAYGAKNYPLIGNYLQQGWTLALLISIPLIIFFWHIYPILIFLGQSAEIANDVQQYFHAYVWNVIPALLSTCNQQFGYAIHKKMLMVTTSLMSMSVLLITAFMLIFGNFGMPKLGIAGLGYAGAIASGFYFIFTTAYFYFEKSFKKFDLFNYRVHQHREHFQKMFKIGWPISVQMGGEMLSFFVSGIMIGWLGTTALAAYQIVNQYYVLMVIPIFSLSQASGILIGHARGADEFHEIKTLSHASITIVIVACLVVACAFLIFPKTLASIYLNIDNIENAETLHLAILIFVIIAFSQLFDGLRNVLIGILRGLFDTHFSMYMSLLSIWLIGMPLSYLFAFHLHLGTVGFVLGSALGILSSTLLILYRWRYLTKQFT